MTSKDAPKPVKVRNRPTKVRPLTARQERFCLLYLATGDAVRAYSEAGYPHKRDAKPNSGGIRTNPYEILANPRIKNRLRQLQQGNGLKTKEDLLRFLGLTIDSLADGLPRVSDQVRASEIIARLNGYFEPERHELGLSQGLTGYLAALRGANFGQKVIDLESSQVKQLEDE
jgi:hypothetical protein